MAGGGTALLIRATRQPRNLSPSPTTSAAAATTACNVRTALTRKQGWTSETGSTCSSPQAGLLSRRKPAPLIPELQWGEIDASHRKLAHRGSYLERVWVSPSTVLRVLLEHGRALPYRPPRQASVKRPWPEWVQYKPRQVWGYDFSEFPRAGTSALAILDLVSRKWTETMLCPEATDVQSMRRRAMSCRSTPKTLRSATSTRSARPI